MVAQRILLAVLGLLLCSFFPRGAQQPDERPSLQLPPAAIIGTSFPSDVLPKLRISSVPSIYEPAKADRESAPGKSELSLSAEIGAEWDRCYQELQAQDEEIKKAEKHLAQLRTQRRVRAEKLADVAKKLAPLVSKAQENPNAQDALRSPNTSESETTIVIQQPANPRAAPAFAYNPALSKSPDTGIDQVLLRLESIDGRLKTLEKPPTIQNKKVAAAATVQALTNRVPEFSLTSKDRTKPLHVAILMTSSLESQYFTAKTMHKLDLKLRKCLQTNQQLNEIDLSLIPTSEIEKVTKGQKPGLKKNVHEICKQLKADYLIQVEVNDFSIYEPGSSNTLHRGRAEIELTISDIRGGGDPVKLQEIISSNFPKKVAPIDATAGNPDEFQELFLNTIVRQVCSRFTNCTVEDAAAEEAYLKKRQAQN
ncbi:hypothetical protein BH10PLA2_BH10PLA2_07620 [soil metagenome]